MEKMANEGKKKIHFSKIGSNFRIAEPYFFWDFKMPSGFGKIQVRGALRRPHFNFDLN